MGTQVTQYVQRRRASDTNALGQKLFSFGALSDIQYCDISDRPNAFGQQRWYRGALQLTAKAVDKWNQEGVQFAVHCGDIIDAKTALTAQGPQRSLELVAQELDKCACKVYHAYGNHCLAHLKREYLDARLRQQGVVAGESYFSFVPHPTWRFVCLDSFDVSTVGRDLSHPSFQQAVALLGQAQLGMFNDDQYKKRFVPFTGGVSQQQLLWLEDELKESREQKQLVVVFTHCALQPGTCPNTCILWNYDQVCRILGASGNVVATFSGHAHFNGYRQNPETKIHHVVIKAVVETSPDSEAFAVIDCCSNGLRVHGFGDQLSYILPYSGQRKE